MNGPHACVSRTPSGAGRASIGYAQVGSVCPQCGVSIKPEYILRAAPSKPTEDDEIYRIEEFEGGPA